ncbi:hypothetical protein [Streptomyces laurentii]|uniref:hypothetical protein n=1 Tax=Streptomyces laurentii TaxID=39478 RepID=UPI003685AD92
MAEPTGLAERSRHLLGHARFMTLATADGTAPWASTVDFVVPGSRTNLPSPVVR